MRKKERALETVRLLEAEYPVAECSLDYDDAWKLLVSVRLAAQCTDARVNQITPVLFEKFPGIAALAGADVDESGSDHAGAVRAFSDNRGACGRFGGCH